MKKAQVRRKVSSDSEHWNSYSILALKLGPCPAGSRFVCVMERDLIHHKNNI